MITTEKVLEERNSVPLIQNSYENFNEESNAELAYAQQRKIND